MLDVKAARIASGAHAPRAATGLPSSGVETAAMPVGNADAIMPSGRRIGPNV
jgi:hypothetical protein